MLNGPDFHYLLTSLEPHLLQAKGSGQDHSVYMNYTCSRLH